MFKDKVNYAVNHDKYGGYSNEISKIVPEGSFVLDIGCSTGQLAKALKAKGCRVVGIDIDDKSLSKAAAYCEKTINCDLDRPDELAKVLKKGTFDAITFGDVLEHVKYPAVLLNNLRPYLKKGGVIAASIPNAMFITNRLRFFFGDFTYTKSGGLLDEDHLRFFTFKTVQQLFEGVKYEVEQIYGVSVVRDRYWFLRLLAKALPRLFAIHIIVEAKK